MCLFQDRSSDILTARSFSYSIDLTFVWVEGHKPFTFPGYKFCEDCLQGLTFCLVRDSEIQNDIISKESDTAFLQFQACRLYKLGKKWTQYWTLGYAWQNWALVRLYTLKNDPLGSITRSERNHSIHAITQWLTWRRHHLGCLASIDAFRFGFSSLAWSSAR